MSTRCTAIERGIEMSQTSSQPFAVRIKANTTNLPAWVPPEGQFANISLNTLYDVRPPGWPTSDAAGPFANWCGGAYATDFSGLGAYVVHGSGHLSGGQPLWAGVWCFDLDTRSWVGTNVPSQPLLENVADYNAYGESTVSETLGHPYPVHTYDSLIYHPAANGGGSQGSLIRVGAAGASQWSHPLHRFDLSKGTAAPTRVVNNISGGGYPQATRDTTRNGVWYLNANGNAPLTFISFTDWALTNHPKGFNEYGNYSLTYIPEPYDCLVSTGNSGDYGVNMGVYVCPIVGGVPQGFVKVNPTGTRVGDQRAGTCWSTLLNCLVSYEAGGSFTVHKLTPPAPGSLTTGTWTWSSETLNGVSGATPSKNSVTNNGAWGRFIEVPAARCFIWCDGIRAPVQAWRLTGM
jgi:hypothetical protein